MEIITDFLFLQKVVAYIPNRPDNVITHTIQNINLLVTYFIFNNYMDTLLRQSSLLSMNHPAQFDSCSLRS